MTRSAPHTRVHLYAPKSSDRSDVEVIIRRLDATIKSRPVGWRLWCTLKVGSTSQMRQIKLQSLLKLKIARDSRGCIKGAPSCLAAAGARSCVFSAHVQVGAALHGESGQA